MLPTWKISHLAIPCNLQKPVPAAPIPMGFGVVKSMLDDAGVHLHFTGVPMNCLGSTIDKHWQRQVYYMQDPGFGTSTGLT